jgi:hypothetical protein
MCVCMCVCVCVCVCVVVVGSLPAIGLPSCCEANWCWKSSPLIKLQYCGRPNWLSSLIITATSEAAMLCTIERSLLLLVRAANDRRPNSSCLQICGVSTRERMWGGEGVSEVHSVGLFW